ncbi:PKD domain-containing protein [Cytophagaceae bacterium ABcell3]|nr:PKD domain-containing protein [Cytophagaceae bacterium ABcell3]
MKKSILLFAIFLTLSLNSFSQTADVTEGCVPLSVSFTGPDDLESYYWEFGDLVTSHNQNPSTTYSQAGNYTAVLRERPGGPIIGTIPITVHAAPVIEIDVDRYGCRPYNAKFTDVTDLGDEWEISKYVWVFGDGSRMEGEDLEYVENRYDSLGSYSVSLRYEFANSNCNAHRFFEDIIEVLPPPKADFSTNPADPITCLDEMEVSFIDESEGVKPLEYSWEFGNGNTSEDQWPLSQTYGVGHHTATLSVAYLEIGRDNCESSSSTEISVGSPEPEIIAEKDTICWEDFGMFRSNSPGNYQWDFGPHGIYEEGNSSSSVVKVGFSEPGYHKVYLTVSSEDGVCSGMDSAEVFVDKVDVEMSIDPDLVCELPATVNYEVVGDRDDLSIHWTSPVEVEGNTLTHTFTPERSESNYHLKEPFVHVAIAHAVSDISGCASEVSEAIFVAKPVARILPDQTGGCAPLNVEFKDLTNSSDSKDISSLNPVIHWEWHLGDGTVVERDNAENLTHTYTEAGEYEAFLIVETEYGCKDTSYAILIEVGENLSAEIDFEISKTEVCPGEELEFTVTGETSVVDAYRFNTEGDRGVYGADDFSVPYAYFHEAGPQDVILEVEYNGCHFEIEKLGAVDVIGAVAKIDYEYLCSDPLDYTFINKSGNATSVTWNFGDGTTQETSDTETLHSYESSGDYSVLLTASNESGCSPTTARLPVLVRQVKSVIEADSLLCARGVYEFEGEASVDHHVECHSGYTWQFPTLDKRPHTSGNSSTEFSFSERGEHIIHLITTDINGCKDTASAMFKVFDMDLEPLADDYEICNPTTVQFTGNSVGDTTIVGWHWDFGHRGETSEEQDPSFEYTLPPVGIQNYRVELELVDALGCTKDTVFSIAHYRPTSNISLSSNGRICLGDEIDITASDFTSRGSHLEFEWDFGDGTTGEGQTHTVLYDDLGPYDVTLNFVEVSSGCSGSRTRTVQLQEYPVAAFSFIEDTLPVFCDPQNFTAIYEGQSSAPHDYFWDNGRGVTRSNVPAFTTTLPKGEYDFSLIVRTSFGCADTATRSLNIFRPEGDFEMSTNTIYPNTICKGDEITFTLIDTSDIDRYEWYFGDGTVAENVPEITHRFDFHPEHGQTVARLTLWGFMRTGFEGCTNIPEQNIYIRQVVAGFDRLDGRDSTLCFNEGPYQFTNTSFGFDDLTWDFGDGNSSTEMNPAHQYEHPGHYTATLHISGALGSTQTCVDSMELDVIVHANPEVEALGDTVCQGEEVQLEVLNPKESSQFLWSPGNYLENRNVPDPVSSTMHSMEYNVLETDSNGCTGTADVMAMVVEPLPLFNWDTTIVMGDEIALPVERPDLYMFDWKPDEGLSCLDCDYPLVRPLEDITYTLLVTDSMDCFTSEFDYDIEVKPETFVKMPTTFTPNGDGANDVVYANGHGIKELLEFSIFNRWGQLIFQSTDVSQGWDGTFKGRVQNTDVYVYKIRALTWKDEVIQEEGYINLVH